jgi:hypothetical protein
LRTFSSVAQRHGSAIGTPSWARSRSTDPKPGPPGLAALLDGERSALREHHARLRAADEARVLMRERRELVAVASRSRRDAERHAPGMRGRLHARPQDSIRLVMDLEAEATAAARLLESETARLGEAQRRLANVRTLVDQVVGLDPEVYGLVEPLRRTPTLPPSAVSFTSMTAFIAAGPQRAMDDFHARSPSSRSLGDAWTLEQPHRPWLVSTWHARWRGPGSGAPGEIYAEEIGAGSRRQAAVWWLGTVPHGTDAATKLTAVLDRQPERNSLAALAHRVTALVNR